MKPFEYYSTNQVTYPYRKDYITYYAYDKGDVLHCGTHQPLSRLKELYPNAVIQEVLDEDAYKAHSKRYNEESSKLYKEFQNDLFEEFEVSDNPKKDKCFDLAWEYGHSSGYREVYNYFSEFVELIQD